MEGGGPERSVCVACVVAVCDRRPFDPVLRPGERDTAGAYGIPGSGGPHTQHDPGPVARKVRLNDGQCGFNMYVDICVYPG